MGGEMCVCDRQLTKEEELPAIIIPVQEEANSSFTHDDLKRSIIKQNPIEMDKILVKKGEFKRINYFKAENIPFEVIWLTISEDLKQSINRVAGQQFRKYRELDRQTAKNNRWSLHFDGYYVFLITSKLYAILSEHSYFEGELKESKKGQTYQAFDDIVYVDKDGRYDGKMKNRKAHGQDGILHRWRTGINYQGHWKEGLLVEGKITTDHFIYSGKFINSMPSKGKIKFIHHNAHYQGTFKDGLYDGQDKQKYITREYEYQGGFKEGRKDGHGILTILGNYSSKSNLKNKKYVSKQKFEGIWHNDGYLQPAVMTERLFMEMIREYILSKLRQNNGEDNRGNYFTTQSANNQRANGKQIEVTPVQLEQFKSMAPKSTFISPPQQKPKKKRNRQKSRPKIQDQGF